MASLRDIKKKIISVKNTQKITSAMKMVSSSKLKKADEAMQKANPYAKVVLSVMQDIGRSGMNSENAFLRAHTDEPKNIGIVIITADKGLCGAFNTNIIKLIKSLSEKYKDAKLHIAAIGKKGYDFVRTRKYNLIGDLHTNISMADFTVTSKFGNSICNMYESGAIDTFYILSTNFMRAGSQVPLALRVLPIDLENIHGADTSEHDLFYNYEPTVDSVLSTLIPRYVNFTIYSKILESIAGENSARMIAMDAATKNAGELINKLEITYNNLRQASITNELLDIVNGAEALS